MIVLAPCQKKSHILLEIMHIKGLCRQGGVASIEAGPKGAQIGFYQDKFANLEGLIEFVGIHANKVKLQANHKLIYKAKWEKPQERLEGVTQLD